MKLMKSLVLLGSVLALSACDSDSNNNNRNQDAEFFSLQVLHASPDAPPVNVFVDGVEVLSGVDFKEGSAQLGLQVRDIPYSIRVDGITPDGDVTVIGPADFTFEADTTYTIAAINGVADIEPAIISQPDTSSAASARIFVLHGTAGPGPDFSLPVDVYVDAFSEPAAPIGTSAPFTFDFRGTIGPAELAPGDYQIRVTLAGDPDTVVYDSGRVPLAAGDDLVLAAVPNIDGGPAAVSLVALTGTGSAEFADVNAPTGLRIGHLSPDTPEVDVVVDGEIFLGNVPFPAVTDIGALPAATYNVAVQATVNPGTFPIGPVDLDLEAGTWYTVLAVDFLANIEPLILTDDGRSVATNAKVRIVHASPTAQDVDIYVVAPGTDINTVDPTLAVVPFKANTGYLALPEGDYEVTVTPTGTKTAAIGPAAISIENGGVYTAIARDPLPGETEFGLIVLADSLIEADTRVEAD
ncbi:MAG: DUF4397 domain-containing protein [Woeseiaceae bacterium]|nr:DUF4397 domain-containing protein [Woeseiaceae bacterium]